MFKTDKILHFIVSGYIFIIPTVLLNTPWPGLALSLGWGFWKESHDNPFDWLDILADILGLTFAFLIWRF